MYQCLTRRALGENASTFQMRFVFMNDKEPYASEGRCESLIISKGDKLYMETLRCDEYSNDVGEVDLKSTSIS